MDLRKKTFSYSKQVKVFYSQWKVESGENNLNMRIILLSGSCHRLLFKTLVLPYDVHVEWSKIVGIHISVPFEM